MGPSHAITESEPAIHLEVRLLGGFSVSIDGVELASERWPSLRSAQLVQLLSLAPQRRMTRDRVVDTLWPQLDPDAGAANLRKAAHHARQALGRHDGVVLQGGEVVLWARRHGGKMLLRIEDTDKARSTDESTRAIFEGMEWLGLDWDEGPEVGGDYGPYRQSERMDIYADVARRLVEAGHAYPCYCTAEELEAEREAARPDADPAATGSDTASE